MTKRFVRSHATILPRIFRIPSAALSAIWLAIVFFAHLICSLARSFLEVHEIALELDGEIFFSGSRHHQGRIAHRLQLLRRIDLRGVERRF